MEACTGAHHWARELQARGYTVRLIAPQFVKPFVKSNKNDAHDAEAICEAVSRPHMRFVSVKSVEQQDIQATHRVREELKAHRNAKANQIRGLVAEYGLVAPKTLLALRRAIPEWLEDAENGLTDNFRSLLHGLWNDLLTLEDRLKGLDKEIEKLARSNEATAAAAWCRTTGGNCAGCNSRRWQSVREESPDGICPGADAQAKQLRRQVPSVRHQQAR